MSTAIPGLRNTGDRILSTTSITTLAIFALTAALVLYTARTDYADMHIMLDTGMFVLPGVLALLFWDMGVRIESTFPKLLAVSFGLTSILAFVHALVGVEWPVAFTTINQAEFFLRPTTWPPPAHLLPIGIGSAIFMVRWKSKRLGLHALLLIVLTPLLFVFFRRLPLYSSPTILGITDRHSVLLRSCGAQWAGPVGDCGPASASFSS